MVAAVVVGYGSIGQRHARILTELGCDVGVVSNRAVTYSPSYRAIEHALESTRPEYVVVANETAAHHATLVRLASSDFRGVVLVEKPVFDKAQSLPINRFSKICVAYNLRFHPVMERLRKLLEGEELLAIQAYVGQYLPEWRSSSDYRQSYSAHASRGGGVLRDLSHELDYINWIAGRWQRICAVGGHLSPLEISSDDVFACIMETSRCRVMTVQMNYLDRRTRRSVIVNTSKHTIEADFVNGAITLDRQISPIVADRDSSYCRMHEALLSGNVDSGCTLEEGLDVLALIEAAERSAARREWVSR